MTNMKLVKYDAACRAIAEATRVDDVKAIKDKAEAMRAYGRQIKNPQLEADAWVIRKRAEDKLGGLSAALDKSQGARKPLPVGGKKLKAEALKAAGISTSAANRYEKFNVLPEAEKERRIARGRAAIEAGKSIADAIIRQDDKKERRDERERELASKITSLPDKRYGVIYADPPWRFAPYSVTTGMDRAADNHYPTMDVDAIAAMKVPAADDCVLFLWATVPMLPEALQVLRTWGFSYKSNFAWVKDKAGTGFWNKNKHELLLIGTRGSIPAPAPGEQYQSAIEAARGAHSAKPFAFREMIEEMFPTLPRVELFARETFSGWDVWGNEVAEAAE
jgi:N6-adenosine-specific RNA methylase IME4